MKQPSLGIVAGLLLAAGAQQSVAVGLGEITLDSVLDEPLNARIELKNIGELSDVEMLVGLASADDFKVAGVEREFHLTGLRFEVDLSDSDNPAIKVTTNQPVTEPYLDFLVELEWPSGRLLREYTLLLDLPTFVSDSVALKQVSPSTASQPFPSSRQTSATETTDQQRPSGKTGGEYSVESGDTLWSIAKNSRPAQYSIHETMAAIQQLNPSAFINGNVNLLKKGAILRLPENSQIEELTKQTAAEFSADSANDSSTNSYSSNTYDEPDVAIASEAGQPVDAVDEQEAESSSGLLKLAAISSTDEEAGSLNEVGGEAVQGASGEYGYSDNAGVDDSLVQEELIKTQRENDELKERLANLQEQVETMQRMAEIESATGAAVQQDVAQGKAQQDDTETKPTSQPADSSAEQPKSWMSWLFYPLVILLGVVIALFLFIRNRKKADDDGFHSYAIAENVGAQEAIPPESEGEMLQIDDGQSDDQQISDIQDTSEDDLDGDLTHAGLELDEDEIVDPLEQADIYLNLGNIEQAEQILKGSLEQNSNQPDVHLKLLGIYASQQDLPQFDMQRAALAELDDPEADNRASALRLSLVGSETMEQKADATSTSVLSGEEGDELDFDSPGVDLDQLSSDIDEIDLDEAFADIEISDEAPGEQSDAVSLAGVASVEEQVDQELEDKISLAFADGQADISESDIDVEEECDTKLQLAQAYIDMEDPEGAREVLEEVVSEGTAEQQQQARQLLETL